MVALHLPAARCPLPPFSESAFLCYLTKTKRNYSSPPVSIRRLFISLHIHGLCLPVPHRSVLPKDCWRMCAMIMISIGKRSAHIHGLDQFSADGKTSRGNSIASGSSGYRKTLHHVPTETLLCENSIYLFPLGR